MKARILLLLASMLLASICYYTLIHSKRFHVSEGFLKIRPSDVSSITIFFNGKSYGFQKANDAWKLVKPEEHGVDQKSFGMFLRDLTMLPKTQMILRNAENLSPFGLDPPEFRIKITHGADKKSVSLLLGSNNEANTSTYAKVEGSNDVLLLGIILKEDVKRVLDFPNH